jgi:hypothetical protein
MCLRGKANLTKPDRWTRTGRTLLALGPTTVRASVGRQGGVHSVPAGRSLKPTAPGPTTVWELPLHGPVTRCTKGVHRDTSWTSPQLSGRPDAIWGYSRATALTGGVAGGQGHLGLHLKHCFGQGSVTAPAGPQHCLMWMYR